MLFRASVTMIAVFILPLRSGKYVLRVKRPVNGDEQPPLYFGLYYSENGEDEWWRNSILKWQ